MYDIVETNYQKTSKDFIRGDFELKCSAHIKSENIEDEKALRVEIKTFEAPEVKVFEETLKQNQTLMSVDKIDFFNTKNQATLNALDENHTQPTQPPLEEASLNEMCACKHKKIKKSKVVRKSSKK